MTGSEETLENYFTEIEEHMSRFPGTPLILSSRDFKTVFGWYERGIPAETVKKGLDRFFEDRPESGGRRRRFSLSYCRKSVMNAWEETKEARLGDTGGRAAFDDGKELERLIKELETAGVPDDIRNIVENTVEELRKLRKEKGDIEKLEWKLSELDAEMIKEIERTRREMAKTIRSRAFEELDQMRTRVDEATFKRMADNRTVKLIRTRFGLPALTLFSF